MTTMRRIDCAHVFYCPPEYHRNLADLCEDRDITIKPIADAPADAKCTWIGSQRFAHKGVAWAMQKDVIAFLCAFSNEMAAESGLPMMFTRHDMLADWPAINCPVHDVPDFDALVINAAPKSGQCPRWDQGQMDTFIGQIAVKNRVVVTNPTTATGTNITVVNKTLSEIGSLSLRAKFIVAIATGPSWAIHNVFDRTIPTFLFLDEPMHLDYGDNPMQHHGLVSGMHDALAAENLI